MSIIAFNRKGEPMLTQAKRRFSTQPFNIQNFKNRTPLPKPMYESALMTLNRAIELCKECCEKGQLDYGGLSIKTGIPSLQEHSVYQNGKGIGKGKGPIGSLEWEVLGNEADILALNNEILQLSVEVTGRKFPSNFED